MTTQELEIKYKQLKKQISRLYYGPTPISEIENLYKKLELAKQTELKKMLEKS